MMDDRISIGYGNCYIAIDGHGNDWRASTPEELIAKLDAAGISRRRLFLERPEFNHDHTLDPKAVAEFVAILGRNAEPGHRIT